MKGLGYRGIGYECVRLGCRGTWEVSLGWWGVLYTEYWIRDAYVRVYICQRSCILLLVSYTFINLESRNVCKWPDNKVGSCWADLIGVRIASSSKSFQAKSFKWNFVWYVRCWSLKFSLAAFEIRPLMSQHSRVKREDFIAGLGVLLRYKNNWS